MFLASQKSSNVVPPSICKCKGTTHGEQHPTSSEWQNHGNHGPFSSNFGHEKACYKAGNQTPNCEHSPNPGALIDAKKIFIIKVATIFISTGSIFISLDYYQCWRGPSYTSAKSKRSKTGSNCCNYLR